MVQVLSINKLLQQELNKDYQQLVTNIKLSGKSYKKLLFTMYRSDVAKTEVALNIASQLAIGGKKVLFIDLDTDDSQLVQQLALKGDYYQLSDYVVDTSCIGEIIYQTDVANLDMILGGFPVVNPESFLKDQSLKDLITTIDKIYDYIIINGPAMSSFKEVTLIAENSDASILVIKSNTINKIITKYAVRRLKEAPTQFMGIILMDVMQKNVINFWGRLKKKKAKIKSSKIVAKLGRN